VGDVAYAGEPETSRCCALFTVDDKVQQITPSLPLLDHTIITEHAKDYFIPGKTSHYSSFNKVGQAADHFIAHRNVVGKVFVMDSQKAGTAFFVSPTILCSAGHVAYAPGPKKFTTLRDAVTPDWLPRGNLYDVEEVGKAEIQQQKETEKLAARLDLDPMRDETYYAGVAPEHITQLDYGFLRVRDYQSPEYYFPLFTSQEVDVAVVSYPGSYDENSLERLANLHHVGHPSIYHAFRNEMGRKHIAPGSIVRTNNRIVAHSASTLRGSSGGPLLVAGSLGFVGIHIEGWDDVNYNLAVSVKHRAFQDAYNQFVVPTLSADDRELLRVLNS